MNHPELKAKALSNPETLAAYESMDVEFSILRQMLSLQISQMRCCCMKVTFVLPLHDDFDETEEKYGYGSLAGKITMSDDFDEPLEDLQEYM
jgi:hypothetical protein